MKRKVKVCVLKVIGSAAGCFITLLSSAEVIESKLSIIPLGVWLFGGPILAGWWAFELFCNGGEDEQS